MKVIDIKNIKMNSINQKFGYNPKTGKLFTNSEYKQFKSCLINELISNQVNQITPPYYVDIYMETYLDIDAPIKAILDALQKHGCIINDRDVLRLSVQKKQIKKGTKSSLQIVVETIDEPKYSVNIKYVNKFVCAKCYHYEKFTKICLRNNAITFYNNTCDYWEEW